LALARHGAAADDLQRRRIANGLRHLAIVGGVGMTELEYEAVQITGGEEADLRPLMQALCLAEVQAANRSLVAQTVSGEIHTFDLDRSYLTVPTSYATAWPGRLWYWLGEDSPARDEWKLAIGSASAAFATGYDSDYQELNSNAWRMHLGGLAGAAEERMAIL